VARGAWAIAGRELGAAFGRPLAYAVLALFVSTFALLSLWFDDFLTSGVATLRGPLLWLWTCLLFVAPAVAMRTFAEEWRSGTWSVVGALPLRPVEVVVGKWLGAVALLTAALALTLPWPVALVVLGEPDVGPIVGGYLGLWLGSAALAAIGVAASAWTDSVVIAFLGAFLAGLVPWLIGFALPVVPSPLVPLVEAVSFQTVLGTFSKGVIDSRGVVLLVAVTVVALRLAVHAVERRRWA
jgi:ABC-2 type transport system permease protein